MGDLSGANVAMATAHVQPIAMFELKSSHAAGVGSALLHSPLA
jgi:hypothetical protein